jgi:hypothetical protein
MGTREAYLERMDTELRRWNSRLDDLIAKVGVAKAEVKLEMQEALDRLRLKREATSRHLGQLRDASADAFAEIEKGASRAFDDLQGALETAGEKFGKLVRATEMHSV